MYKFFKKRLNNSKHTLFLSKFKLCFYTITKQNIMKRSVQVSKNNFIKLL